MNVEIANRLHQLRKQHNLSQEDLASKIGISRQAVSKWERAEASPDTDNLILLAKLYNVSIDELLKTDSYPLPDTEPVSLKKDSYTAAASAVQTHTATASYTPDDDGEIYPNNNSNSYSYSNSTEDTDESNENKANNGSPFGNIGIDAEEFEKFKDGMQNFGKIFDTSIKHVEKAGKILGENIDKAGSKLKEEIKKYEETEKSNTSADNTYNYEYNYQYNSNEKHEKKQKKHKDKENRYEWSLFDKLITMFLVIFFGWMLAIRPAVAFGFLCLIPTFITLKIAHHNQNLMHFCYPTLITAVFLFTSIFGYDCMQYTWPIFLTIPLYYTTISAFRKRNPLIFCYPVLVAYIFCVFVSFGGEWAAVFAWPLFLTIPFYYVIFAHIMKERRKKQG